MMGSPFLSALFEKPIAAILGVTSQKQYLQIPLTRLKPISVHKVTSSPS